MGKLNGLILFLVALEVVLVVFEGQTPDQTAIWQVVTAPFDWGALGFIVEIGVIAATLGAAQLVIGNVFGIKTDFMVLSIVISAFISWGVIMSQLANAVGKYANNFFCNTPLDVASTTWTNCPAAIIAVVVLAGGISLYYILAVLDWWRQPSA